MNDADAQVDEQNLGSGLSRIVDRIVEPRVLGPIVGAVAVAIAFLFIHEIGGKIRLNHIIDAVASTSLATVAPALAFTLVSLMAMALYDVMAIRHIAPDKVPTRLALFAGFVGYGFRTRSASTSSSAAPSATASTSRSGWTPPMSAGSSASPSSPSGAACSPSSAWRCCSIR